jgi:hypothetical protein
VDKVLKLRRPMLRRTPALMVHTDLLDCHLYVVGPTSHRAHPYLLPLALLLHRLRLVPSL